MFKAIHPAGTLETHLVDDQKVGRLDAAGMPCSSSEDIELKDIEALDELVQTIDEDEVRIKKARAALFGVDSIQSINDFEVGSPEAFSPS